MMGIDASSVKRYIKPKADSTLLNMKKVDLIEYVRTLEHNYNVAVSFNEQQARHIEDMMKNGVIPQQWISVEDRLPDRDDRVIVFYETMRETAAAIQIHKAWAVTGSCTHWMPLPEPPRVQGVPDGTDHV